MQQLAKSLMCCPYSRCVTGGAAFGTSASVLRLVVEGWLSESTLCSFVMVLIECRT